MAHSSRTWRGARSPQGKKRVRQSERRHAILGPRRTAAKTYIKTAVALSTSTDAEAVQAAVIDAVSALDQAAKVGAIHPNAAARRKSRLMRKVNAAQAGEAVVVNQKALRQTGKAAAAKAAKARIAAGKASKAKGEQTAAGKARAALSKSTREAQAAAAGRPSVAAEAPKATATKAAPKATKATGTKAAATKAAPKAAARRQGRRQAGREGREGRAQGEHQEDREVVGRRSRRTPQPQGPGSPSRALLHVRHGRGTPGAPDQAPSSASSIGAGERPPGGRLVAAGHHDRPHVPPPLREPRGERVRPLHDPRVVVVAAAQEQAQPVQWRGPCQLQRVVAGTVAVGRLDPGAVGGDRRPRSRG